MVSYNDRAEKNICHAAKLVNGRDSFPLDGSEDAGEPVGRTTPSYGRQEGTHPVLPFDIVNGPEQGKGAEKRPHEREGAGLDAAQPAEIEFPKPKDGASIAASKMYASSAPMKRQKQRKSVNVIDELFLELD